MAEPFIGEIRMFGFNFAPRGWAACDGQFIPINQNSALFSLLGTIYGGDGRTTFALPDLRSRMPLHYGQGPGLSSRSIGSKSGAETTTLTASNLPPHSHTIAVSSDVGNSTSPVGNIPAVPNDGESNFVDPAGQPAISNNATNVSGGGGQSFNNMPPYLAVNFCIALTGIFPSRS